MKYTAKALTEGFPLFLLLFPLFPIIIIIIIF